MVVIAVAAAVPVGAQTIEGIATDVETGEAVAGVELELRNERGVVVSRTRAGPDGRFHLLAREPGPHSLHASMLGYAAVPPTHIELGREVVEVEIQLSRSPIELDPLVVRGRRYDARHDATFEGAMARYERLPSVGTRRVVLRTDPEFTASFTVRDVLRWFPPGRGCAIVFSDGRVATTPEAALAWLNEASTNWLEALEYYRTWQDAPLGLRDVPPYIRYPSSCAVVALWPRQDPPPAVAWWRRALRLTAVVGVLYGAGRLWKAR